MKIRSLEASHGAHSTSSYLLTQHHSRQSDSSKLSSKVQRRIHHRAGQLPIHLTKQKAVESQKQEGETIRVRGAQEVMHTNVGLFDKFAQAIVAQTKSLQE